MKWLPNDIPVIIDSPELPTANLVSLDLEYSENGSELVCIGVYDGCTFWVYFDICPELVNWLRQVNWVCADGIHAELKILNKLYGGFSAKQIVYDVRLMGYVFDSAAKDWALKSLAKRYLGVDRPTYQQLKKEYKFKNIKELPQEVLIDYNGADCVDTWNLLRYFRKHFTRQQWDFYNKIELPTNHLLAQVEAKGIKIDTQEVRRIHNEHSKARRRLKRDLFQIVGTPFNPNSPKQVLPLLIQEGAKVTKTDEDTIKRYRHIPFVEALLAYRGEQKITSTYTIPLYTEAIKAVDNRIHARFVQNTITGRLSSSDPINLQNQPASVRSAFVAEEGNLLVDADWTNIELYLPAHFSGENKFIDEFSKPDGDLHKRTAELIFGHCTDEQRRIAKTCNFLLTNSGSAKRLSVELSCSQKEAQEIYDKFWKGYPVLAAWLKETKRKARADGGVSTMYGRWVLLPQLKLWCGRANCPVFGNNGFFCNECYIREETERQAISILVQGTASDLMKLAALRLYREYQYIPIALVHDELMYEEPVQAVEQVAANVKNVMESLCSLKVPLKAKVNVGRSWAEVH